MSRALHRKMMMAVDTLKKINEILGENLKITEVSEEQIVGLLSECQDSAVAMGGIIERLHGKETESVKELKAYCDLLYPLAMALHDWNSRRRILLQLMQHIARLRTLIAQEVPNRLEVVFFPYKAAMWDSLESVYLAAKQDLDCDAYVVPVPYYDLRPDRSFGQLHYEANLFPDRIKITDWKDYSLEERYPDIIYIHNPYDDCNLITSVVPRYYAKNLSQYTDCLVYIPYFVLGEIEPNDQNRIEPMKHFCCLPGVIYAHKVVVQSENMRRIYINEYRRTVQKVGVKISKEELERKFLGIGSPKLEKVLITKNDNCVLPKEWIEKMQKSDGTYKKVIFYNTSIVSLLEYKEKMLEKMRYVFSAFKEKEKDIVLLWRPHPLIQATISSMLPELWESYKKLLDIYLLEGWGIYDDTPDVDRAISVSNAYYGDTSSVVEMYRVTGKPVMLQEVSIVRNDCFLGVPWGTCANGYLWGVGFYGKNTLWRIDLISGKVDAIISFSHEIYSQAIAHDNKLILLPGFAKQMAVYNIDEKQMLQYDMQLKEYKKERMKFAAYMVYGNTIFLFPNCTEDIVVINVKNMKMEYIDKPIIEYKKHHDLNDSIFAPSVCFQDGKMYIPCANENMVLIMDAYTREYKWETIPLLLENRGIQALANNGSLLFLITKNGEVFCWDRKYHNVQKILNSKYKYRGVKYANGAIWLFPDGQGPIISYDIENKDIKEYYYNNNLKFYRNECRFNNNIIEVGEKLYVGLWFANGLIEIDTLNRNLKFIKYEYNSLKSNKIYEDNGFLYEAWNGGIKSYIEAIKELKRGCKNSEVKGNIGKDIYDIIIGSL